MGLSQTQSYKNTKEIKKEQTKTSQAKKIENTTQHKEEKPRNRTREKWREG